MSNRRRPKPTRHCGHLRAVAEQAAAVPPELRHLDWTDEPAGRYPQQTVEWISARAAEALRLNVWECEDCGMPVLCFDRHPGVTPFMVAHSTLGGDCQGMCRSNFYNGSSARAAREVLGDPSHEWYRPSAHELKRLRGQVRAHVLQGGLLVRAVVAA